MSYMMKAKSFILLLLDCHISSVPTKNVEATGGYKVLCLVRITLTEETCKELISTPFNKKIHRQRFQNTKHMRFQNTS